MHAWLQVQNLASGRLQKILQVNQFNALPKSVCDITSVSQETLSGFEGHARHLQKYYMRIPD